MQANLGGWALMVVIWLLIAPGIFRLVLQGCAEVVEAFHRMRVRIKNAPEAAEKEYAEKN